MRGPPHGGTPQLLRAGLRLSALAGACAGRGEALGDTLSLLQVSLSKGNATAPDLSLSIDQLAAPEQPVPKLIMRQPLKATESSGGFLPMPVSMEMLAGTRESIHNKLAMAHVRMQARCRAELEDCGKAKCRDDPNDCGRARELLDALVWATNGQVAESMRRDHVPPTLVQSLLGLRYWLYHPGPTWCFVTLDKDKNGGLSIEELQPSFGEDVGRLPADLRDSLKARMFQLMDEDGDGKVSREELAGHLRAAVRVRDLVPTIDEEGMMVSTDDFLRELKSVVRPPRNIGKRTPHWVPFLVVAFAAVGCWLLHYLCCAARTKG